MDRHARWLALAALLAGASCSQNSATSSALDPAKVGTVVVGRSSRTDVFTALGRPARTEASSTGETWVYSTQGSGPGGQSLVSGATSALGVAGAFVPYLGLAGSSVGLANVAAGAATPQADVASLTVSFGGDGIVRDCVYSSTAVPAGVTGSALGSAGVQGCRRPAAATGPAR